MEPIKEGATGAAVEDIQERLGSLGYTIDAAERDEKTFGRSTATAVARFRLDHGLTLGDAVDAATWSALEKYWRKVVPAVKRAPSATPTRIITSGCDDRVRENPAYLTVVLLGRVITELGTLPRVDASVVEDMFASDLAFLQDFYRRINAEGHTLAAVTCPQCNHEFAVDVAGGRLGES